jgi:hypothetical protein
MPIHSTQREDNAETKTAYLRNMGRMHPVHKRLCA